MVNIEEIDFSAGASGAQKEAVPAPRQAPPTKEEIIRRSARRLVAAQEKAQMDLKERFRKLMAWLFVVVIVLQIPVCEVQHPSLGKVPMSPLQVSVSYLSNSLSNLMGPEKHDVVLKVMLFPGIQFRNAWKLFHCHVRRSDLHCRQPFVTWASALQSTAPLLAPQEIRRALEHTLDSYQGMQMVVTGCAFLTLAAAVTLLRSSAILSVLGVATLGFACWRNHLPLKYGMYLVVYLVHMSARFPMASKRGVREQAHIAAIANFERILRASGMTGEEIEAATDEVVGGKGKGKRDGAKKETTGPQQAAAGDKGRAETGGRVQAGDEPGGAPGTGATASAGAGDVSQKGTS